MRMERNFKAADYEDSWHFLDTVCHTLGWGFHMDCFLAVFVNVINNDVLFPFLSESSWTIIYWALGKHFLLFLFELCCHTVNCITKVCAQRKDILAPWSHNDRSPKACRTEVLPRVQQPSEEQSHDCQPGHLTQHETADGNLFTQPIPQMKSSLSVCWALSRYLSVFGGIACKWEKWQRKAISSEPGVGKDFADTMKIKKG